ncbi:AraC family transcriptional regulator [Flavivirga eckloniae]|uniref:AraC family transcriptional regulator n=1 Tax=Flavivirga eckloniae TaxID=1803846 RepID=A0A2K9PK97_9FLAO|nr:AraC family transcriptional regulator [Flavivirga eckloniae]AUP77462.1 AraC family transcriptional regulator [Flavivirga eckloniae]
MKPIPVLNIKQFEQDVPISDFYSSDLTSHLERHKDFFHKPHSHDFFLCVIFSKGSGIHEIDFNTYSIKPGSVFFLRPGQTHYWKFDSPPKGYIFFHKQDFYELHFSKSKLEQFPFYYSHKNPPTLNLDSKNIEILESKFKDIYNEYCTDFLYKKQKIASLINTTYIDLTRHYNAIESIKKETSLAYVETLRSLEKLIDNHFKAEKSATFYANQLNITSKHLNRITKATLGKTTTDLITERIILESKRLMVHSNNTLSSISELLGYEDYAYFSRVFKLKVGKTPLAFKKSYQ